MTPTFSWPWMIGKGVSVSAGVPAYCFVSPSVRVLVGAADPRHLHPQQRGAVLEPRSGELLHLVATGGDEDGGAYEVRHDRRLERADEVPDEGGDLAGRALGGAVSLCFGMTAIGRAAGRTAASRSVRSRRWAGVRAPVSSRTGTVIEAYASSRFPSRLTASMSST